MKTKEQQLKELDDKRNKLLAEIEKEKNKGMRYVIVRTYSAGVHAGLLFMQNGKEVILKNARRVWYWDGAASLSELAVRGTSKPDKCKFPVAVPEIKLTEAIEVINTTKQGQNSIESVKEWTNA